MAKEKAAAAATLQGRFGAFAATLQAFVSSLVSLNWLNPKMANLIGCAIISFALYDNFAIYKPLAAQLGPLLDGFGRASSGWRGTLGTAGLVSALLGSLGWGAGALSSFLGWGAGALSSFLGWGAAAGRPLWAAVCSYFRVG